jgi:hypothetical protein
VSFLLCFLALHLQTLDIRCVARYLARSSLRSKNTLSKLYQIVYILEAAGVIRRSGVSGVVAMVDDFYVPIELTGGDESAPFGIASMLNHPREKEKAELLELRRRAFHRESED